MLLANFAQALGMVGGICDAGVACTDGEGASGWPLFGQFVAHDITSDRSPLALQADPEGLRNFHAPRANLVTYVREKLAPSSS